MPYESWKRHPETKGVLDPGDPTGQSRWTGLKPRSGDEFEIGNPKSPKPSRLEERKTMLHGSEAANHPRAFPHIVETASTTPRWWLAAHERFRQVL